MRSGILTIDDVIVFPIIKKILVSRGIKDYKASFPTDPAFNLRTMVIHDYISVLINDAINTSKLLVNNYCDSYKPKFIDFNDTINELCVRLSDETAECAKEVYRELTDKVIMSAKVSTADSKSECVIKQLFKAFYKHPKQLPDYVLTRYYSQKGVKLNRLMINESQLKNDPYFIRIICDHIAGMTDQLASREYKRLYIPD